MPLLLLLLGDQKLSLRDPKRTCTLEGATNVKHHYITVRALNPGGEGDGDGGRRGGSIKGMRKETSG